MNIIMQKSGIITALRARLEELTKCQIAIRSVHVVMFFSACRFCFEKHINGLVKDYTNVKMPFSYMVKYTIPTQPKIMDLEDDFFSLSQFLGYESISKNYFVERKIKSWKAKRKKKYLRRLVTCCNYEICEEC